MKLYIIQFYLALVLCLSASADEDFKPELYAFFNGIPKTSYDEEAKILKDLGYDGISQIYEGGDELVKRVTAYKKHGLKVMSVYLDATDTPIDANLVKSLANGGMIELKVQKFTPGIAESIRKTAEMASKLNIRVALYPHHGFAVATMPQALDLIEKVNHPNLGVMFNLCHFLKNETAESLESILKKSGSRLFAVSTCGADLDGKNWGQLIQTLDKGTFSQKRLLTALKKINFEGPIGLQCYALKGNKHSNLKKSMVAWKTILAEL